jgi:hypothetical protein
MGQNKNVFLTELSLKIFDVSDEIQIKQKFVILDSPEKSQS